ncbi:DUF397 domain-containing protein [Spirillospora sp. NPDC052269]
MDNRPIERAVRWTRSSRCSASGACVEVAELPNHLVGARDARIGDASPVLRLSAEEWHALLTDIREGALDLPA